MKFLQLIILIALIQFSTDTFAQLNRVNTMAYDSVIGSPKATLKDVAWLAGNWKGEAFGGIVEELWSAPLGGSMMGVFRLVSEGEVGFYEIETISEEAGSLIFRLKHFHADLKGWEEKEKTFDFPLVKVSKDKAFFDDLTLERVSHDEINMYVVVSSEGKEEEVKFNYKRTRSWP